MPETQRTISEVYTLLADNTSAAISPEDLRDGFETWRMRHGQIYVADPGAAITISDTTSYFEATNPTWTLSAGAHQFDESGGNGRLTYTGSADVVVHIAFSFCFTTASNNQVCHWRIGKNGTADAASEVQRKTGTGSDVGSSAAHLITSMSQNDYLSVFVRNSSSSSNATLVTANLQVVSMPT